MTIVASIFPIYEFTRNVVGKEGDVTILMPPGVEPHEWEPRPSDMARMGRAQAFVYVGERMEPWAGNVIEALKGNTLKVVEVGKEISAGEEWATLRNDPHFWLDLEKADLAVDFISRALGAAFPEKAQAFAANAAAYRKRIDDLDARYARTLQECHVKTFVVGGHSAFAHLAARFGFEQIPVYGVSPDAEPSPKRVADVVQAMKTRRLKAVFYEELVNPRLAQVIAQETGARLIPLNPAGNVTAARRDRGDTFLSIMEENLANLREGLSCE